MTKARGVGLFIKNHRQFLIYSIIGASGATIDLLAFLALYNLFGVSATISTAISISLGIINNFILNAYLNFKVRDKLLQRFVSFYSVGLFGLLVSVAIIALLNGVFGINANAAKIASIPIIVVLQYALNKNISFSEKINYRIMLNVIRRHAGIVIISTIFLLTSLFLVAKIPFPAGAAAGPDEAGHYRYNVEFLIENHRLPVAGEDDKLAYETCRNNEFGLVTCAYSYVAYPGFNYVVSATSAVVAHDTLSVSHLVGARLASTAWGLIFIAFLYLSLLRISKSRLISTSLTAAAALIPQVLFTFSYINQDAHSLAISAIVMYAAVRFVQNASHKNIILAAVAAGGLLPLAKYNYYVLLPFLATIPIYMTVRKQLSWSQVVRLLVYSGTAFVALASFWFIRNFVIYGDPLGQSYVLSIMAEQPYTGNSHPLSIGLYRTFTQLGFFDITFRSFWASLGYMSYYLKDGAYEILRFVLVGCSTYFLYLIALNRRKRVFLAVVGCAVVALVLSSVALSFYNSATYDFQPQGRYIYQVIAGTCVLIACAYRLDERTKYIAGALSLAAAYSYFSAIDILVRVYL